MNVGHVPVQTLHCFQTHNVLSAGGAEMLKCRYLHLTKLQHQHSGATVHNGQMGGDWTYPEVARQMSSRSGVTASPRLGCSIARRRSPIKDCVLHDNCTTKPKAKGAPAAVIVVGGESNCRVPRQGDGCPSGRSGERTVPSGGDFAGSGRIMCGGVGVPGSWRT